MATSRSAAGIEAHYRSKVHYEAKDGKPRHAVVLRVFDGAPIPEYLRALAPADADEKLLLVIAGTSKEPRPHGTEKHVCVKQGTRAWVALRLACTTWFKDSMLEVIPARAVTGVNGQAPPNVAQELEALIPIEGAKP